MGRIGLGRSGRYWGITTLCPLGVRILYYVHMYNNIYHFLSCTVSLWYIINTVKSLVNTGSLSWPDLSMKELIIMLHLPGVPPIVAGRTLTPLLAQQGFCNIILSAHPVCVMPGVFPSCHLHMVNQFHPDIQSRQVSHKIISGPNGLNVLYLYL